MYILNMKFERTATELCILEMDMKLNVNFYFFFFFVIFLQVNMEVDDYGLSILKYRTNGQALE